MNSWPDEDPHPAVSLLIVDKDSFNEILGTVFTIFPISEYPLLDNSLWPSWRLAEITSALSSVKSPDFVLVGRCSGACQEGRDHRDLQHIDITECNSTGEKAMEVLSHASTDC